MDEKTDAQLVTACCKGSSEAYAVLVRRHSRYVYAICLGMLGNVSDSEDLTQEVFVKGMRNIQRLRDASLFLGWIAQIARNLSRDFLRARKRQVPLQEDRLEVTADGEDFSDLHAALEQLPEVYRLPLMLYYFDGQSSENVAKALNISPAGACTRLCRARKELRRLLEEEVGRR